MRVLFREDDDFVLKEVDVLTVSKGRVLLEATTGDPRIHVVPHGSWTNEELEAFVRYQMNEAVIDLEPISQPK